ncbi:MAG TPA: PAS domain-containing sensor histidine kinase [Ktedonobacteraceae bacterium]|nr:PAS domain-containing sensor histidine kinase [Ktedonobacteraceae bacterium]
MSQIDRTDSEPAATPLEQQEELFQFQATILNNIQESVIVTDLQGKITYWNKGAQRIFGYASQEMLGKTPDLLYPDKAMSDLQADLQQIEAGIDYYGTWEGRRKDGTAVWVDIRTTLMRNCDGETIGFLGISKDVTEHKQIEDALHLSEERARRLIDANIIGVVIADIEYIFEANDAFLEIVGYTREELQQRVLNWSQMTPPEYAYLDQKAVQELLEEGHCTPFEKEYIRKNGSHVPILLGAAKLQDHPFQCVCFILDISERKALEQRKDDFISMASHELKTPLTTVKALTQLLKRRLKQQGTPDVVSSLSKIEDQINRLTRLVNELLDVSKIQMGRLEYAEQAIDLDALVAECVEILQQISTTHTIRVHDVSRATVYGDSDRLLQVLTNLISNAIKYSPNAKTVDIEVATTGETAIIRVHDYGFGISQEHQSKIFDRFYRISNEKTRKLPGLGMGLYITAEIVKRHGGKISVESTEGMGSIFTVTLPLARKAS